MDCEERLITQADSVKALSSDTRVFVYRNLVKALPWYTSVREKLEDPAYSGWFLKFKDGVDGSYSVDPCTYDKCSELYHDQDQTPGYPTGDGNCAEECDCGESLPCGEYLWDHRNGSSLRTWLVNEFVLGHASGVGHASVDGLYLDDNWRDSQEVHQDWWPAEGFCSGDPFGGPSEEYPNCTIDMGLTQDDTMLITQEFDETTSAVKAAVAAAGGFTWQNFLTTTTPPSGDADACVAYFRDACDESSAAQTSALMFKFTNQKVQPLQAVAQDLATFLLVRGPYAWLGYAWIGCTSTWGDDAEDLYYRPPELDVDYGEPSSGVCAETEEGSGVFTREWTKASVSFDCATWAGSVVVKG